MKLRTTLAAFAAAFALVACSDSPMPTEPNVDEVSLSGVEAAPSLNAHQGNRPPHAGLRPGTGLVTGISEDVTNRVTGESGTFEGTYTIHRFVERRGELFAVGVLEGSVNWENPRRGVGRQLGQEVRQVVERRVLDHTIVDENGNEIEDPDELIDENGEIAEGTILELTIEGLELQLLGIIELTIGTLQLVLDDELVLQAIIEDLGLAIDDLLELTVDELELILNLGLLLEALTEVVEDVT